MMSDLEIFNDDELDDQDNIAVLHDIEQLGQYLPRTPFQPRNRFNPIIDMQNEREFKLRFRFNKKSVEKLIQMVEPHLKFPTNKRGLPWKNKKPRVPYFWIFYLFCNRLIALSPTGWP